MSQVVTIFSAEGVEIKVDIGDLWVTRHKWHAKTSRGKTYAFANIQRPNGRRLVPMHQLIMDCPDGSVVDHIDGDGLNNSRSNLRVCSTQQNNFNRIHNPTGAFKSPYKGVWKSSKGDCWAAQIGHNKKAHYLGTFPTAEDAALAYNEAAIRLFGAYAKLNVVPETPQNLNGEQAHA